MIANDFEPSVASRGGARRKLSRERKPNMLAVCLGVLCVAGVFGMLGLLYSLG